MAKFLLHMGHTHTHTQSTLWAHMAHGQKNSETATERARESKRWHLLYDVLPPSLAPSLFLSVLLRSFL